MLRIFLSRYVNKFFAVVPKCIIDHARLYFISFPIQSKFSLNMSEKEVDKSFSVFDRVSLHDLKNVDDDVDFENHPAPVAEIDELEADEKGTEPEDYFSPAVNTEIPTATLEIPAEEKSKHYFRF